MIENILYEIELLFWDNTGIKPNFSRKAFFSCNKIFLDAIMDKMFDYQDELGLTKEQRSEMTINCGNEIRELVKKYTGIDMHETKNFKIG